MWARVDLTNKTVRFYLLVVLNILPKFSNPHAVNNDWNSEFLGKRALICAAVVDLIERPKNIRNQAVEGSLYFVAGAMHILVFGEIFFSKRQLSDFLQSHDLLFGVSFREGNRVTDFSLKNNVLQSSISILPPANSRYEEKHIHIAPYFQLSPIKNLEEFWVKNPKWDKFCNENK